MTWSASPRMPWTASSRIPGSGVDEHQAVVMVEDVDRRAVVLSPAGSSDLRVVVAAQDLEPGLGLGGVLAHRRVPVDRVAVAEQVGDRGGRAPTEPVSERAGIGVGVDGDDPVAAVARHDMAEHERRRRLPRPSLAREHDDPTALRRGGAHGGEERTSVLLGPGRAAVPRDHGCRRPLPCATRARSGRRPAGAASLVGELLRPAPAAGELAHASASSWRSTTRDRSQTSTRRTRSPTMRTRPRTGSGRSTERDERHESQARRRRTRPPR